MKKLLLSLGLCAFLAPQASLGAETVSIHYLPLVLSRADEAMERANQAQPAGNFIFLFFSWINDIQAAIVSTIDTENRVVLQADDLQYITPCLHYDLLVLESKINDVNQAMETAIRQKKVSSIWSLKELVRFLNARYNHLAVGATDPRYVDEAYDNLHSFDTEGWCCQEPTEDNVCALVPRQECLGENQYMYGSLEQCSQFCDRPPQAVEYDPICPFDTDYLPPTAVGYGCDLSAMELLDESAMASLNVERQALDLFLSRRDAFLQKQKTYLPTADGMQQLVGQTPENTSLRVDTPRAHKRVWGCADGLPAGATRAARRTPFSMNTDEASLVQLLRKFLEEGGRSREQEDVLKYPEEFPEGSLGRAEAIAREGEMNLFQKGLRELLRAFFQYQNVQQAGRDALPFVQAIDGQQALSQTFTGLRQPMLRLYDLASLPDQGARGFVKDYASFLRKSCIYRPCNQRLEEILGTAGNDQCFPYATGLYLSGWHPDACTP